MTDDEQMAPVVRPGGERDIDEARRHHAFVAGYGCHSHPAVRIDVEVHKP